MNGWRGIGTIESLTETTVEWPIGKPHATCIMVGLLGPGPYGKLSGFVVKGPFEEAPSF
jgi:hypothetical protein